MARISSLLIFWSGYVFSSLAGETGPINGNFPAEDSYDLHKPLNEPALRSPQADWTMNFWVDPQAPIPPKTLLAGFGDTSNNAGQQRYFASFDDGLRFWGSSLDIPMHVPLDPNRWQMLTAVYSAGTIRLYKDGVLAVSGSAALQRARQEIHLAPMSPWSDGGHFSGRIALFVVLDRALNPAEIHGLLGEASGLDSLAYEQGSPPHWEPQRDPGHGGDPHQSPDTFPVSRAAPEPPQWHAPAVTAPLLPQPDGSWTLAGPWKMQAAPLVPRDGAALSQPGAGTEGWYDATVPGTVLTTLVDRGVYPDPLFGLNNRYIPESLNKQDYWYRLEFTAPAASPAGSDAWITLNGINYRAEVWLNGQRLGEIVGAFKRGTFPVGGLLHPGQANALAVRISPPPHPGIPHEQSIAAGAGPNGGALTQDGPTFFCTEGWDWIPGIRDRDTGLWQDVVLKTTGPVTLGDPQVITHLVEPIGSQAQVTVAVELANASQAPESGRVSGSFEGVAFSKTVTLPGGSTQMVRFTPAEFPQLAVAHPRLWWPNGYGRQDLYHLHLAFRDGAGMISDQKSLRFGMREISVELNALTPEMHVERFEFSPTLSGSTEVVRHEHEALGQTSAGWMPLIAPGQENSPALKLSPDPDVQNCLVIKVNGQRIAIRGGNWGMDDAMKRVSRERLEPYVRLEHDANFDMIRNWCGQSTEEELYDLCDEYGLLVWNEFWLSTQGYNMEPSASEPFLSNAEDTIKRFRNHPSIALWCGRNEGVPPPAINEGLDTLIREYDGTRYYQPNSTQINMNGSGPWSDQQPVEYFTDHGGFTTELGMPSPLSADSIRAMMAPADVWPIGDVWAYHDWCLHDAANADGYMDMLSTQYGSPSGLEDFVRKAQMLNYTSHRAMFEGMNASLWHPSTGRLMWMSHPSWPSSVWQIYGWNYDTNASFYGVKKACEPIHVQMDLPDHGVLVCNTTLAPLRNVTATARVYGLDGKLRWSNAATLDVPANDTARSFAIDTRGVSGVWFLKLELRDLKGNLLSDNFYWWAAQAVDFQALDSLPKVTLAARAKLSRGPKKNLVTIDLSNDSATPALMTLLSIRDAATGRKILPAFASDNYVSLLPGEKRSLTIEVPAAASRGPLSLSLEGWNIAPRTLPLASRDLAARN
ncbi:MAG: LamG-like jellyroll fold domain-containing protein [Chthoniobacteraceae bacterium]